MGIRYSYAGLNAGIGEPPIRFTASLVDEIHEVGGTMLGTSRGPQPIDAMVNFFVDHEIQVLLCVGGDGPLRSASDPAT